MWFRLAALWGCPVREAKARISYAEFTQWIAFYTLEPWGCEVEDHRAGTIAATVHNMAGYVSKRQLGYRDFFPNRGEPREPQKPEDTKAIWMKLLKLEKGIKGMKR